MILQIMNHQWKIVRKNKIEMEDVGKDTLGTTVFPDREIWLLDSLSKKVLRQVVTHETVHALLAEFSCHNIEKFSDEFICDFIANNIEMIFDIRNKILNLLSG